MGGYTAEVAAQRAGVDAADIGKLTDLGILVGDSDSRFTDADIRRVQVVQALVRSGLTVEELGWL